MKRWGAAFEQRSAKQNQPTPWLWKVAARRGYSPRRRASEVQNEINAEVTLAGYASGTRRVEYWDTWEGRILETRRIGVTGGKLRIPVPLLERDIAIKVY